MADSYLEKVGEKMLVRNGLVIKIEKIECTRTFKLMLTKILSDLHRRKCVFVVG